MWASRLLITYHVHFIQRPLRTLTPALNHKVVPIIGGCLSAAAAALLPPVQHLSI